MMEDANTGNVGFGGPPRRQPEWIRPTGGGLKTGLRVCNSLTGLKEEFVPIEKKNVMWYICGPTVYDSPHLGHARTYLSFDIIRRVMEDYFGYSVEFCMNITDVDDKIIIKSRRAHLLQRWKDANTPFSPNNFERAFGDVREAVDFHMSNISHELKKQYAIDVDKVGVNPGGESLSAASLFVVEKYLKAQKLRSKVDDATTHSLLEGLAAESALVDDALGEWLDAKMGPTLDPSLMNQLTADLSRKYETEFMKDMQSIGVRPPDVLTRVSEFIPQIISTIETIMANGYAYVGDGGVYFDTQAFDNSSEHFYAKLMPSHVGNAELLREGEGALSLDTLEGKRSKNDFALWKASKLGEPCWESPWGSGRPGWHIECSAMAGYIFGRQLDIHAGGVDLKFPHHDNELAQSEAFFNCKQWVNYFLHSGHLHIDELKMSKSLKNFITIKEVLKDNSARSLRLLFLLQPWDSVMNFQRKNPMAEANSKEKAWNDLFLRTRELLSQSGPAPCGDQKWTDQDFEFNKTIRETENQVHAALCDNFNTPQVIRLLSGLTTESNKYFLLQKKKNFLLYKSCKFITKILRIFGVLDNEFIGTFSSLEPTTGDKSLLKPISDAFTSFRAHVRKFAIDKRQTDKTQLLKLCDDVRDNVAPELGLKIVDGSEFGYFFVDRKVLHNETKNGTQEELNAEIEKTENQLKKKTKEYAKWLDSSVTPEEFIFSRYEINYSDALNSNDCDKYKLPLGKKKLEKIYTKQQQKHQKFKEKLEAQPDFMKNLTNQINELESRLSVLKGG